MDPYYQRFGDFNQAYYSDQSEQQSVFPIEPQSYPRQYQDVYDPALRSYSYDSGDPSIQYYQPQRISEQYEYFQPQQQNRYESFSNTYNYGWMDHSGFKYRSTQQNIPQPQFNNSGWTDPRSFDNGNEQQQHDQLFPAYQSPIYQNYNEETLSPSQEDTLKKFLQLAILKQQIRNSHQHQQEKLQNLQIQLDQIESSISQIQAQDSFQPPSKTISMDIDMRREMDCGVSDGHVYDSAAPQDSYESLCCDVIADTDGYEFVDEVVVVADEVDDDTSGLDLFCDAIYSTDTEISAVEARSEKLVEDDVSELPATPICNFIADNVAEETVPTKFLCLVVQPFDKPDGGVMDSWVFPPDWTLPSQLKTPRILQMKALTTYAII